MNIESKSVTLDGQLRYCLWLLVGLLLAAGGCQTMPKDETRQGPPAVIVDRSIYPESIKPIKPAVIKPPEPIKPITTYSLEGQVGLTASADNILAGSAVSHTVLYFESEDYPQQAEPGRYEIQATSKLFTPAVLVIPVGSEVVFLNKDEILHNVFSVSEGAEFDLGYYGQDESRSYLFEQAGRVLVNCSVHDTMSVDILVVDTAFFTQADDSGRFVFDHLPAGAGELKIWHPQANVDSYSMLIPDASEQQFTVKITKPRVPIDE